MTVSEHSSAIDPMQNQPLLSPFGKPRPEVPAGKGHPMQGEGSTVVPARPEAIWDLILDDQRLAAITPGASTLRRIGDIIYAADVSIGVGPLKTIYRVEVALDELEPPFGLTLQGGAQGRFGHSFGKGLVRLTPVPDGTLVDYVYALLISGQVARLGGPLIDRAGNRLIDKFFNLLAENTRMQP